MLKFAHPEYLWYLLLLPAVASLFWLVWMLKRRKVRAMGEPAIMYRMVDERSKVKYWLRSSILLLSGALLVLAFANPRIGTKFEEVKRMGIDLIVALDVSASMRARDIAPSRIQSAKRGLQQVIERLRGDRIGIIIFAGEAYTQLPLTTDYGAAAMLTDIIDIGSAPTPGTAIGSAITLAMQSFEKDEGRNKAMIIITDGENHEDDAVAAAKEAAGKGIVIHTIGMGSPEGAPIPTGDGSWSTAFKLDTDGNPVLTRLDEKTLEAVAEAAGGAYRRASNTRDDISAVFTEIEKMEKKEYGAKQFTSFEDRFQYPLAAAILLLLIEAAMSEKRNRFLSRFKVFAPTEE